MLGRILGPVLGVKKQDNWPKVNQDPEKPVCMQVKKQQLEPDMEQWTGSKSGKEYVKDVYCHPVCLTCM